MTFGQPLVSRSKKEATFKATVNFDYDVQRQSPSVANHMYSFFYNIKLK